MAEAKPRFSLVIAVYNEAANIRPLYDEICRDLAGHDWEAVYVDDGSSDGTLATLRELHAADPRVRVVSLRGNHGQPLAMRCGLRHARGEFAVFMDGDGQFSPASVLAMWRHAQEHDCELVSGFRSERNDHWWDCLFSRLGNCLLNRPLGVRQRDFGSLKLLTGGLAERLLGDGNKALHVYALAFRLARACGETEIVHRGRTSGRSKWNVFKRLALYIEMWILCRAFPVRALLGAAAVLLLADFFYGGWLLLVAEAPGAGGVPSLLLALLLLAGGMVLVFQTVVLQVVVDWFQQRARHELAIDIKEQL